MDIFEENKEETKQTEFRLPSEKRNFQYSREDPPKKEQEEIYLIQYDKREGVVYYFVPESTKERLDTILTEDSTKLIECLEQKAINFVKHTTPTPIHHTVKIQSVMYKTCENTNHAGFDKGLIYTIEYTTD